MLRKQIHFIILCVALLIYPASAFADSGFEFYLFGVNVKAFQGSDWKKIAAGALASVVVHELGHALYLESRGKDWDFNMSYSGAAIETSDALSEKELRGFGRAGFLLQTGIGLLLTSFEKTRQSDFTKGWAYANIFEVWSYSWRNHDHGDDFELIRRGGGNPDSGLRLFCAMTLYNTWRIELPTHIRTPMFGKPVSAVGTMADSPRPLEPDLDLNELSPNFQSAAEASPGEPLIPGMMLIGNL